MTHSGDYCPQPTIKQRGSDQATNSEEVNRPSGTVWYCIRVEYFRVWKTEKQEESGKTP